MRALKSLIFFTSLDEVLLDKETLIAEIDSPTESTSELLGGLARKLAFPGYFGHNWDALDECMNDFHWIDGKRIAIVHHRLPRTDSPRELRIYLEILIDSVKHWKKSGEHELVAAFPATARDQISQILSGSMSRT